MRSHGSRRSCRRSAGAAATRTPGPGQVTGSGSPGLLSQLTARQEFLRCRDLEQRICLSCIRRYTQLRRGEMSSRAGQCSGEALFPVHLPQRQDTLPAASMRVKVWASSPNRPDGYQKRHGMLNLTANPKTPRWLASAASRSCHRAGRVVVPDLFIRPAHDGVSDVAPSCHTYNFKEAGGVCLIHESSATVIARQLRWPVLAGCQPAEQPIRGRHR